MTHEEAMNRADPNQGAALDQPRLNLDQGHVALLGDELPDEAAVRFDLAGMPVTTARLGHGLTMLQRTLPPADCTRHADPKAGRSGAAAQAGINRAYNPVPQIL